MIDKGVIVFMENDGALITVAMLTTFLGKENKDYLDLVSPFVLRVMPPKVGEQIVLEKILLRLDAEYGFVDLPINVLKRILDRLAKQNAGFIEKKNRLYYVSKISDESKFEENREKIRRSINDAMKSLADYFDSKTFQKGITIEKAKDIFINFMEYYGYTIISDIEHLKKLTKDEHNYYHVARFIIEEYKNDTVAYDSILEIVKGFFVYKAIYYFSTEKKKAFKSKLKNTDIYLDTRLVINALGYSLNEDKIAINELLKMIKDSGGKAKVFKHTLDEIAGILTKYAKDPLSRATMTLEYFDNNSYDDINVLRLREALPINLEKLGIEVVDTPAQNVSSLDNLKDRGLIDEVDFRKHLETSYQLCNKSPRPDSLGRDVDSISAISRLRGRESSVSIEDCKAIFVTNNIIITKAVNQYFKERFSKGEVSFSICEIDITALLWLRSFDSNNEIPKFKLLENAYSALKPSKELIDNFYSSVKILELEGRVTPEEALLIRTQPIIRKALVEITNNNPQEVNDEKILNVMNNYINSLTKEKNDSIIKLQNEIDESNRKKGRAIERAEEDAGIISTRFYLKLKKTVIFIFSAFIISGISSFIYGLLNNKNDNDISIMLIPTTIIGVLGVFDSIISKMKFVDRFLLKLKQWKFDKVYKDEIEKIEKYFS